MLLVEGKRGLQAAFAWDACLLTSATPSPCPHPAHWQIIKGFMIQGGDYIKVSGAIT